MPETERLTNLLEKERLRLKESKEESFLNSIQHTELKNKGNEAIERLFDKNDEINLLKRDLHDAEKSLFDSNRRIAILELCLKGVRNRLKNKEQREQK